MMTINLRDQVETTFLPEVEGLGFVVVEHFHGGGFDNALVVLKSAVITVRIVRERSQLFMDVASVSHAEEWFDIDLIMRLLGHARPDHLALQASSEALVDFGGVIRTHFGKLVELFDNQAFDRTKEQLEHESSLRAEGRFDL